MTIYPLGGGVAQAVADHVAAADPHPQYLTVAEADAAYAPYSTLYLGSSTVETFSRIDATQGRDLLAGQVHLTYFTATQTATVSNFTAATVGVAAAGLTLARIGLYSVSGNDVTLEAACANDTSLFTSTFTVYTRAFDTGGGLPASFEVLAGQRYAIGIIATGSTMPQLYGNGFSASAVYGLAPRMTGSVLNQTNLVTTATISLAANFLYWARLS
jgi:hypothetical protein